MREIKFRVWFKKRKRMVNTATIIGLLFEDGNYFEDGGLTQEVEVMQFTGLKDNIGKEIYEGDIMYVAGVGNMEIIFSDGSFGYLDEGTFFTLYDDQEGDIERVIGNKFEHPELLK